MNNQAQNSDFSFPVMEEEILEFWKKRDTFNKSLQKNKGTRPYVFYDGPPFATGLPHHGHLVPNALKDIIPRYFTMKGRYVERRFGWDCHGLPIEYEIDKKLKMPSYQAVIKLGIKGYNDECRLIIDRYANQWRDILTRYGRWVDFDNDYKTMDTNFMESSWWAFKKLWEKGLIYRGTRIVPVTTALGTVLSNFEAGQNYQNVQDPAITVSFSVAGEDYTYFLAWTTTPWTLPSNLALCVGERIDYVKVIDEKNNNYYLANDRLEYYQKRFKLKVVQELKGIDLKGRKYTPLFSYFSSQEKYGAFQILTDDFVTTDTGTGIVHIAPGFGEDDHRVVKEANLENVFVCPVTDYGKFTDDVSDYSDMYVKDADKKIISRLKEEKKLFEQSTIYHSYPFCYRSDTPLIYKAIPSWYVKVEQIKDKLIKSNSKIRWVPEHIKDGRFGKWLENARDWSISRNRIWGTPIPIWENNKTGNLICIGSLDELEKYTGERLSDLHREYVDPLKFSIEGEEGTYTRISEILDCWFESASMPYAQIHYPFENKELFDKGFPAEFISEGLDQTRGWFYTLTVLSTALFDSPAFLNVIVNGIVCAEDGKKMSKRLRNYTPPIEIMNSYGADSLRLYLINSGLVRAEDQAFLNSGVKDMVRQALLPWYNAFKFFQTYAKVDGFNCREHLKYGENIFDQWIISKLQTLKKNIEKEMSSYHLYNVVPALFDFIEDLTNWYIRLNRNRFWGEGLSDDKCYAYTALYQAIYQLTLAMAPFTPFLSEYIYLQLLKFNTDNNLPESVHLCSYPLADNSLINEELEDSVTRMQQIILLGRNKRNQKKIKTKIPLSSLTIIHEDKRILDIIKCLENYIKQELNVKNIAFSTEEDRFINLYAKPNSPILGKRLGKDFGKFKQIIDNMSSKEVQNFEKYGSINIENEVFSREDILVFREAKENTEALSNRFISINLDCKLTDELLQEGMAREVVNRIQKTRKDMNLHIDDRIYIRYKTSDKKLKIAIDAHEKYICQETLSLSICEAEIDDFVEYEIENKIIKLSIKLNE